ncbi:aromatic ring-hydroxylating oxygenase subunit alpha [Pseudomonas delhiensis]|uniref:aromatic ring-hydroxylating oxygenase subunit alpha n=1 Tax=Pseudomonas delhiensis TaxID=366289 RepID=UPI00315ADC26
MNYDLIYPGNPDQYLDDLCRRVDQGMDEGLLPVEVFRDDAVFRAEMERIFARNWIFVAHTSEIPNNGDFVLRRLGIDKVIVTRDDSGQINVMLNHCRHRGTELCHHDKGNARHFKCPYHGWVYRNNGEWAGAPHLKDAYDGPLDKKEWGLLKAAKVESIHGFIFASLNPEIAPLREYLGGAAWMMDAIFGLHPDGMKVIKEPERFIVKADWKSGAENFSGDAYHVSTAHLSAALSEFIPGVNQVSSLASGYDFGNGNSFIGHALPDLIAPMFDMWGYTAEQREKFDLSTLDEVQLEMLRTVPPTIGTIFPNFSFLRFPQPDVPGQMPIPFTSIRMWQPVSPGVMELWNYEFEYACLPEDFHERAYLAGQFGFGSGGIFEQDDTAVWEGIAKVGGSPWARTKGMRLHYQQKRGGPDPDWKGPGEFHPSIYGEYSQERFWRRWVKEMREGKGAVPSVADQCLGQGECE